MSEVQFDGYVLRTTDVSAARAFYAETLGLNFETDPETLGVVPLPDRARAQGAPSHWLGCLGVNDVEFVVEQMILRGSQRLGPPSGPSQNQEAMVILRDPCQAVVAIHPSLSAPRLSPVVWHQLHTADLNRSWSLYSELFGWLQTSAFDSGGAEGTHRVFRWKGAASDVGSMANTARLPNVHPHWLFSFRVLNLEQTLARVRSTGGCALRPVRLESGVEFVACEDPQGAAFGLLQAL